MSTTAILIATTATVIAVVIAVRLYRRQQPGNIHPLPILQRGQSLPGFHAVDESGATVHTNDLHGTATVMLFVRGNWCPFCSSQVEDLVLHYKEIIELGARLILVTPRPQETTRRVAEFFEVEFDFWLDEGLAAGKQLGLVQTSGVPGEYRREYGEDTLWPMALVIDSAGIIRFAKKSKQLSDRPDPKTLLSELRAALGN